MRAGKGRLRSWLQRRFQRNRMARSVIEDRRELEIDDAKPSIGNSIGDVSQLAIFMAHAVLLEFGKESYLTLRVQLIDASTAIGGHDLEIFRLHLEQSRH